MYLLYKTNDYIPWIDFGYRKGWSGMKSLRYETSISLSVSAARPTSLESDAMRDVGPEETPGPCVPSRETSMLTLEVPFE